jgi:3'(2'), 5'-bisphosphate nucleotidase
MSSGPEPGSGLNAPGTPAFAAATMRDGLAELVRHVGQQLLSWRTVGGVQGEWHGTQFHAKADQWAHREICLGLERLAPAIPIVSEEDTARESWRGADLYWLIDPIDGTASYAGGFDGFVTQVALMERENPVLAAVFAPVYQELFLATKGSGSTLNGVRLPLHSSRGLTLIDNDPTPQGIAADLYREMSFSRYVECGSIGLKICRVADGTADVFFKAVAVRDWDVAAPQLILQEAHGCLVDGSGADITYGASRQHIGIIAARDAALVGHLVNWKQARDAGLGLRPRSCGPEG